MVNNCVRSWDQVGLEIGLEVGLEIVYLKHPNVFFVSLLGLEGVEKIVGARRCEVTALVKH